jgi:Reverse transcriptase (RNA-dependent DNA polymerase)
MSTVRVLLSVTINLGWNLSQMDVKNVFLQGTLKEEVCMTLPLGYENDSNKDLMCKLNKFIMVSNNLLENGMTSLVILFYHIIL